jgi:hypothetical protein
MLGRKVRRFTVGTEWQLDIIATMAACGGSSPEVLKSPEDLKSSMLPSWCEV